MVVLMGARWKYGIVTMLSSLIFFFYSLSLSLEEKNGGNEMLRSGLLYRLMIAELITTRGSI